MARPLCGTSLPDPCPKDIPAVAGAVSEKDKRKTKTLPSKPKRSSSKQKAANPNHKLAVDLFCTSWKVKHGRAYAFVPGKDAKLIEGILAHVENDLDAFGALVKRHLADADPFVARNAHSISTLQTRLNSYLTSSGSGDAAQFRPAVDFDTQPRKDAA